MDSPENLRTASETNNLQETVALDDRKVLIKATETPIELVNQSKYASDRSSALDNRLSESIESNGSHVKLITPDQCESSNTAITPMIDRPADVTIQPTATRDCSKPIRLDNTHDCQISVRSSSDYVTASDQSAEIHATVSNQSADSVVCRICHLSATESNVPLDETGCECRGSLRLCHRRCVEHWMLVKMSKQCEICQQPFKHDIVIPEFQIQAQFSPATGVEGSGTFTTCHDSRRLLFFVIYILLLFTAGTSTTLSLFSREEHMKRKATNVTVPTIEIAARNERMYAYGVSLAVTIFVGFHMIAVGVLWVIAETIVLPRERLLRHHIEIFRSIYAAQLQDTTYGWMNGSNTESANGGGLGGETTGDGRGNPMSGQTGRDESDQNRRTSTQRHREQRRIPEIIAQVGNQPTLPFRRQVLSRPAVPPPVLRRLTESHRGVTVGHRRQEGARPSNEVNQADLDRNIPHESPMTQAQNSEFLERYAAQMGNVSNSEENNQYTENKPSMTVNKHSTAADEITTAQNLSKYLADGDQGDQMKLHSIEMQDLTDEASKSEAAACCTSHIIGKEQPVTSDGKGEEGKSGTPPESTPN